MTHKLYLTFDVEDFINDRSLKVLNAILKLLKKYNLTGTFFITGHMAEKLKRAHAFPELLTKLETHEIGYHSSSHSVHPGIFEYTDLDSYQKAYDISLIREVSHINPLTGEVEGNGGIKLLREIFPCKKIEAFRAPGFSWSPPHLEALKSLGIKYDFSTNISQIPIEYKGITFFPFPLFIDTINFSGFLRSVLKQKVTVVDFHPNFFVNEIWWDSPFFSKSNPKKICGVPPRPLKKIKRMFHRFENFLRLIKILETSQLVEIGRLEKSEAKLSTTSVNIQMIYEAIVLWPSTQFDYKPKFIYKHLLNFFNLTSAE